MGVGAQRRRRQEMGDLNGNMAADSRRAVGIQLDKGLVATFGIAVFGRHGQSGHLLTIPADNQIKVVILGWRRIVFVKPHTDASSVITDGLAHFLHDPLDTRHFEARADDDDGIGARLDVGFGDGADGFGVGVEFVVEHDARP